MKYLTAYAGYAPWFQGVNTVYCMDALHLLRGLPSASVDLIATDPPYNIGKDYWDKWATVDAYLEWLDGHLREFKRVLKPNGSLYLFAATKYGAHVEIATGKYFNVLNRITWRKADGWHKKAAEEDLRAYFPASEVIIFAEQLGADAPYQDSLIDGNSTYWGACEQGKRSVFGDYLIVEFTRANVTRREIAALFPSITGNLTGCVSNWLLGYNIPTPDQYQAMRAYLNRKGGDYLRREYEDLRREYEDLRREYEDLRRPFFARPDAPYTDVWDFRTVNTYPGKHPAEKPAALMEHIISTSSRPGDVVLDCFCGSGSTLDAARRLGRRFIGNDFDTHWSAYSRNRVSLPFMLPLPLFDTTPAATEAG